MHKAKVRTRRNREDRESIESRESRFENMQQSLTCGRKAESNFIEVADEFALNKKLSIFSIA